MTTVIWRLGERMALRRLLQHTLPRASDVDGELQAVVAGLEFYLDCQPSGDGNTRGEYVYAAAGVVIQYRFINPDVVRVVRLRRPEARWAEKKHSSQI
jgi:hypothetical protein